MPSGHVSGFTLSVIPKKCVFMKHSIQINGRNQHLFSVNFVSSLNSVTLIIEQRFLKFS